MVSIIDDFVVRWSTPPFSYIIIAIIVFIIAYILFRKVFKPAKEHFKGEGIDYVIKELNLKGQFTNFSRACKKGKLHHNLGEVNVKRVMQANRKVKDEITKEMGTEKFILFETGSSSILSKIPVLKAFVKTDYYVINNDDKFIEKNKYGDVWIVKPTVYMHKFADVWICSVEGTSFLTDLIYKRTYENAREEEMNYIKRVVWYNDLYASKMTKDYIEHELKHEDFDKKVQRETGVRNK